MPEVDTNEVLRMDEQDQAILLDVREEDEWTVCHIPGARHIPLNGLPEKTGELPKDRTWVLHSWDQNRSDRAAHLLLDHGFRDIVILDGGLAQWRQRGLPITYEPTNGGSSASASSSSSSTSTEPATWLDDVRATLQLGDLPRWAKTVAVAALFLTLAAGLAITFDAPDHMRWTALQGLGVGLAGGLVGGLVGGGIGVISVPLIVLVLGFPIHLAVGTNLVQSSFTASSGVWQHRQKGNVKFRIAKPIIVGAVIGAPTGALVSLQLPETVLLWIFSGVLVTLATFLGKDVFQGGDDQAEADQDPRREGGNTLGSPGRESRLAEVVGKVISPEAGEKLQEKLAEPIEGTHNGKRFAVDRITLVLIGIGVGFGAGLLGIGGGPLIIPIMTTLLGLPAHLAVGTGLVVIAGNSVAGSLAHVLSGNFSLVAATFLATGGIAGTAIGTRLSDNLSGRALQGLLMILVLAVAWKMLPI